MATQMSSKDALLINMIPINPGGASDYSWDPTVPDPPSWAGCVPGACA